MRTTVTIEEALLAQAKERAARSGKTLSAVVEDALRAELHRKPPRSLKPFRLITCGGSGVQPGVNLERLGDLLDEADTRSFLRQLGRSGAGRRGDSSRRKRPRVRASA